MKVFRRLRNKSNSLLISLMASFFLIICMLASFNYFSISFSKDGVRDEVIRYNTNNLNNTMESYESHLDLIKNMMIHLYSSDHVQHLEQSQANRNYETVYQTYRDLQALLANPLLYIDNIILYSKADSFILDKDTSSKAETYFTKFYASERYDLAFWQEQFDAKYTHKLLPASTFEELSIDHHSKQVGKFLPFVVKNYFNDNFYLVAMIHADKLFQTFHSSINHRFYIVDPEGQLIYASGHDSMGEVLPMLDPARNYVKADDQYYFYKKGLTTGYTYINIIPDVSMSAHQRMNMTLLTLLIVSVLISGAASILLSIRLNQPIKRIAESIQHLNDSMPLRSKIRELDMIGSRIGQILKMNRDIHEDLQNKTSHLRQYAYMNRLRNIPHHLHDLTELVNAHKPFIFVLFDFIFVDRNRTEEDEHQWIFCMKEYIDNQLSESYEDLLTFQVEKNQVITIISSPPHKLEAIRHKLRPLKQYFDQQEENGYVTIAVSSIYENSMDLSKAYEQVLELKNTRQLNRDTEIILKPVTSKLSYHMLPAQESEFDRNLRAGNLKQVTELVQRILSHMEKKTFSAYHFRLFSEEIVSKTLRILYLHKLDTEALGMANQQIKHCHTVEELIVFLQEFLKEAIEHIEQQRNKRDPITDFVYEYLEQHYADEISLDRLAEKLNITSGYLSTYFKEKTGTNFIDYVNEVRVEKAKKLLNETNLRVQEVAKQSGYYNLNSFHRMFKKFTGVTPSQYRKGAVTQLDA